MALVQIDWHGEILLAKAPAGPDRPAMRRAQALAAGSKAGLAIMREILAQKLSGQAAIARMLGGEDTATLIEQIGRQAAEAATGLQTLACEASAAAAYWSLWSSVCMRFARRDRVPDHWQAFGNRRSTIAGTKKPRHAASAPGAMLNYLYGVAASQMTIALTAAGLDPDIGVFHADKEGRPSLAYDAIEAARPYIEAWLLCVLAESRFSKRDFFEESDGTIRITRPLTSWLAMTAPLWGRAAETIARWLSECFKNSRAQRVSAGALSQALPPLPTALPSLPQPGRVYKPTLAHAVMPRACHECGKAIRSKGQQRFCSLSCAAVYRSEMRRVTEISRSDPRISRSVSQKHSWRAHEHHQWNMEHSIAEAEALRRWYAAEVMPKLAAISRIEIAKATDTSYTYARFLYAGRIPHPRHFGALARLVGLRMPNEPQPARMAHPIPRSRR